MAADPGVLVLRKEEIESILKLEDSIEAVEEGFKAYNSGRTVIPFPVAQRVPDHKGDVHIKPGYIKGYPTYTVKIASGFYGNQGQKNPGLGPPGDLPRTGAPHG